MHKNNSWYVVCLITLLICITCVAGYAEEQQNTHFYFAQITDTHLGDGDHLARTEKAVELINSLPVKIECVVHTGDITMNLIEDKKIVNDGLAVMKKLKAPVHYLPGNHDILDKNLEATRKAYIKNYGGLVTQAEYNGVVFIFVYTEPLRRSYTLKDYQPLKELEACLKDADGKPAIIFHHAPSAEDFYRNTFHDSWKKEIREKWIKLINAYNVKGVIAGHFHRDELHWLGDVPLYVSASIAGYWGRQATYRIYEYKNGRIGYRTQYIE